MAIQDTHELFETALKLPVEVRAELAAKLIETLDDETDEGAEQLWAIEVARRVSQLDEGTARTVPWSEVRRQLLASR